MIDMQLDAAVREPNFTRENILLAHHLDLLPLTSLGRCWGYVNCCNCNDCLEREHRTERIVAGEVPAVPSVAQPWEPRTARKAA